MTESNALKYNRAVVKLSGESLAGDRGFGIQPPSPDWGLSISSNYGMIGGGFWWTVLFDALAIASLVIGVNLAMLFSPCGFRYPCISLDFATVPE